jgi:predicted nicotinamide N-methyase
MPYWAELWPSGLALAAALPPRLDGLRVIELGCGLGVPSLTAAARGAEVTALDWAEDAVELLRRNALRNQLELTGVHADWRTFTGSCDLVLGADLLYEQRNAQALIELLPALTGRVLLGEPGRPHAAEFFELAASSWEIEELPNRVYRLTRPTPGDPPPPADA